MPIQDRGSRRRAVLSLLGVSAAVGGVALGLMLSRARTTEAQTQSGLSPSSSSSDESAVQGPVLGVREVDPARPSWDWVAEGRVPTGAPEVDVFNDARFDLARDLWEWTLPFGNDDAAGVAIRRCAVEHEPSLQSSCQWSNRFVIEQDEDADQARVVAARQEIWQGADDSMCESFARCELDAILANRADVPLPEDLDSRTFTLITSGRGSIGGLDADGPSLMALYESARDEQLADLQKLRKASENVDMTSSEFLASLDWNLTVTEAQLEEYNRVLELLRDAR